MPGTTLLLAAPRRINNSDSTDDEHRLRSVMDVLSPPSDADEPEDELWPWVRLPGGGLELRFEPEAHE